MWETEIHTGMKPFSRLKTGNGIPVQAEGGVEV
jgi:hypothetical protein